LCRWKSLLTALFAASAVRFRASKCKKCPEQLTGGAGGIRTLDRALQPYNGLANRRLQPLGHSSVGADMPDTGASRKRPIARGRIPGDLTPSAMPGDHGSGLAQTPESGRPREADGLTTRSTTGFRSRARVICATSVGKQRGEGVSNASFMLRVQRPSVRVMTRRRGAPNVVPFQSSSLSRRGYVRTRSG
jgi:hypothetical protein